LAKNDYRLQKKYHTLKRKMATLLVLFPVKNKRKFAKKNIFQIVLTLGQSLVSELQNQQ
jgi:hypothetical protein